MIHRYSVRIFAEEVNTDGNFASAEFIFFRQDGDGSAGRRRLCETCVLLSSVIDFAGTKRVYLFRTISVGDCPLKKLSAIILTVLMCFACFALFAAIRRGQSRCRARRGFERAQNQCRRIRCVDADSANLGRQLPRRNVYRSQRRYQEFHAVAQRRNYDGRIEKRRRRAFARCGAVVCVEVQQQRRRRCRDGRRARAGRDTNWASTDTE